MTYDVSRGGVFGLDCNTAEKDFLVTGGVTEVLTLLLAASALLTGSEAEGDRGRFDGEQGEEPSKNSLEPEGERGGETGVHESSALLGNSSCTVSKGWSGVKERSKRFSTGGGVEAREAALSPLDSTLPAPFLSPHPPPPPPNRNWESQGCEGQSRERSVVRLE